MSHNDDLFAKKVREVATSMGLSVDEILRRYSSLVQKLTALGIGVKDVDELASGPLNLVCMRVIDELDPPDGSIKFPCDTCKQEVYMAPSSVTTVNAVKKNKQLCKIICMVCFRKETKTQTGN